MKMGEGEYDISFTWAKTGQYVKTAAICCTPEMPGTSLKGLLTPDASITTYKELVQMVR